MPKHHNKRIRREVGLKLWENNISQLWCDVCAILECCVIADTKNRRITVDDQSILALFDVTRNKFNSRTIIPARGRKPIPNPYLSINQKYDKHLLTGLMFTHQRRRKEFPRLASLTIEAFYAAKETLDEHDQKAGTTLLPSPLAIIYNFLIVPDHAYTAAYALAACRNWLSRILKVWPVQEDYATTTSKYSEKLEFITETDLNTSIESFKNYDEIGARWPELAATPEKRSRARLNNFVGHFVATRSFALLWLNDKTKNRKHRTLSARDFLSFDPVQRSAEAMGLENEIANKLRAVLFRQSSYFESIPPTNEFVNQLFGFPIALKGMDVVFNGGLLPAKSGGLVISVSGRPGTGKTTFTLAMANAMAPFGTSTFFVSLEESRRDIIGKLGTVQPEFERTISILKDNQNKFTCYRVTEDVEWNVGASAKDNAASIPLDGFRKRLEEFLDGLESSTRGSEFLAGYCPAIIVIDNLNLLLQEARAEIEEGKIVKTLRDIIHSCRRANAITILVSAEDLPSKYRIDYFCDVFVQMEYRALEDINEKPVRIFNLIKSRHQLARQGSHIFHLGSGKGFRVVPHMDSLMDKKEIMRRELPDSAKSIPILNTHGHYLDIYPNSNVLIHGFGSAGKAGFALKLLWLPPVPKGTTTDEIRELDYSGISYRRRILIVSFLYPRDYYANLAKDLSLTINREIFTKHKISKPIIDDFILYPGYLGAQDFLNKIVSRLDRAKLEGIPYTGIMIDGLHNILLQYKTLQETPMVWAMLYSILSRYRLTVVSTFTNFSLTEHDTSIERHDSDAMPTWLLPDQMLMQEGMAPFLHALVKATDFYLYLQEHITGRNRRIYVISTRAAIGQPVPEKYLIWNRKEMKIMNVFDKQALDSELIDKPRKPRTAAQTMQDES